MAPGFGLAPQPKGIGDQPIALANLRVFFLFGLAPQPKGIGDITAPAASLTRSAGRLD